MFEPVPNQVDFVKLEHEVLDFWGRSDAFGKLQAKNRGRAKFRLHRRTDHGKQPNGASPWLGTNLQGRLSAVQGHAWV